jgi:hypothetical protein
MKSLSSIVMAAAALVATQASAQGVNLTGRYLCIQLCEAGGQVAFVTQNGWNLNLLNEVGEPSRAWIDWYGHIWAERWNEGAIYSPDGMTIQFDRGTVWRAAASATGGSKRSTATQRQEDDRASLRSGRKRSPACAPRPHSICPHCV